MYSAVVLEKLFSVKKIKIYVLLNFSTEKNNTKDICLQFLPSYET
jgi:hypothetical protein